MSVDLCWPPLVSIIQLLTAAVPLLAAKICNDASELYLPVCTKNKYVDTIYLFNKKSLAIRDFHCKILINIEQQRSIGLLPQHLNRLLS